MPKSEIVVLDVAGARAIVSVGSAVDASGLNDLGLVLTDHIGERPIHDMGGRAYIVKELINMGAVFFGSRDWSPVEVVNYLRSQGRLNTKSHKIVW